MIKRNKLFLICAICVVVLLVLTIIFAFIIKSIIPKTYTSAKKECEKILSKNQVKMEQIAVDSLKQENNVSGEFKNFFYNSYPQEGLVSFEIGSQGMLGGQYWELIFTQDGTFKGESKYFLYKESDGNNIIKAERLNEHWWYLWTDYDGSDKSYK